MTTDIHRPHILGKPEPMPEELLRHVVASLANRDVLNLSAEMGRRLLADRDYQAQRAEAAERERDELLRAAANIGTKMPGLESEFGAMGSAGAVTRSAASLMVAAVRLHPKVETGIVCTVDVDGREMEVIAQWRDAPARTNAVAIAADNANLKAEVARLRSRVRVEAEDVERAGVSWAKVRAWLERAGWSKSITSHGWRFKPEADSFTGVTVAGGAHERARAVTVIAAYLKRPDLDILDEMARMEVSK